RAEGERREGRSARAGRTRAGRNGWPWQGGGMQCIAETGAIQLISQPRSAPSSPTRTRPAGAHETCGRAAHTQPRGSARAVVVASGAFLVASRDACRTEAAGVLAAEVSHFDSLPNSR